jgi:Skp family chaperone for outer membrane proteins
MRYSSWSYLAVLGGMGLGTISGCGPEQAPRTPADRKVVEAKVKINEANDATAVAITAKRDEYAVEMQKKLDELDAKYKDLEKRAAEAKDEAKKKLDDSVKAAKAKRDVAAKKLDELKSASADRWEKIKDGVGNAFDDLKKAFE